MNQQEIMQAFITWAQSKNIPPPQTKAGRQVLFARFMNEVMNEVASRADQVIGGFNPTQGHRADDGETVHLVRNSGGGIDITEERNPHDYSDFDQMVDEKEHALHQAHGDDLAGHVIYRNKRHAEISKAAPYSTTTPQSALQGVFGNTAQLQAGDQPVEVARWQGDDNTQAVNISITLGQARLAALRGSVLHFPFQARPYAIARWGVGNIAYEAYIDALMGQQFVVSANYISLSVAMQPLLSYPGATATPVPLILSGSIGFKQIERGTSLTYSWFSDTFFTDSPNIPVPPFAKNYTVYSDTQGATIDMGEFDIGNTLVSVARGLDVGDSAKAITIKLPGNVTTLAPQAFTGQPQHVVIVFELAL